MVDESKKKVPPDGGWGYVVIFATASAGFIIFPVIQNFGLLFRPVFEELEFSATDISTIINVNSGSGFIFGVLHGPLLKIFGYRKYGIIGAAMGSLGLLMTSMSTKFAEFILYYGILNSIGIFIVHNAFGLALNSYFQKKRTFAAGIAFTIAGIGSAVMPVILSKSMGYFGARGTALILSGLVLNVIASAMLLQPVKWHYKYPATKLEDGKELKLLNPKKESDSKIGELDGVPEKHVNGKVDVDESALLKSDGVTDEKHENPEKTSTCWKSIVKWFDLDLLKDPVFISILVGMSFAFTGEIMFSMMFPIILGDKGFNVDDTASIMATVATVDIIFRFIVAFVDKLVKRPTRDMYMFTLIMLISSRYSLTVVTSFWDTMLVASFLGVAKGFRTVYMTVVMANYVPIHKLPSAQGLQTLLNGIILLSLGPVVGKLRDYFGHFIVVVHLANTLSLITLTMWALERVIVKIRDKSKKRRERAELKT